MQLTDFARQLLLRSGQWHRMAHAPQRLSILQDRPTPSEGLATTRRLPDGVAAQLAPRCAALQGISGDQLLLNGAKKPAKRPSPTAHLPKGALSRRRQ